jgi:hypothetical protein
MIALGVSICRLGSNSAIELDTSQLDQPSSIRLNPGQDTLTSRQDVNVTRSRRLVEVAGSGGEMR